MKRVTLICLNDLRGGAAVVTYRLMGALCSMGVDARMVVVHKESNNPRVDSVGDGWRTKAAFMAEHADIYLHNGRRRDDVFKVSTGRFGVGVDRHPWVADADAVILNWVNQGMMSLDCIGRICSRGIPVVWTMHDMWNMTGVCHHAGSCARYRAGSHCGSCPQLNSDSDNDLSTRVQQAKARLYEGNGRNIKFVAVSNWLADCACHSSLMQRADIEVIPNAFPVQDFMPQPRLSRAAMHLPPGKLIVMGAARLDDPIKNLPLAVETLNLVAENDAQAHAVFFGDLRDPRALESLRMPHTWLGKIGDRTSLASLYAHAHAVLSTSHYETLPGTLIEGISAGAMAVTTGHGGQADIVSDGTTGYICGDSATELADALTRVLATDTDRDTLHSAMARRFNSTEIARRYLRLMFGDKFLS